MLSDLRFTFRSLLKTPGFTTVAVITLALGIGMNTAIFSLLNTALLRSLPVPNPQDLRAVNWTGDFRKIDRFGLHGASTSSEAAEEKIWGSFTYPAYELFRDRAQGVSEVFAFQSFGATLVTRNGPTTAGGLFVSGNFFQGYGARPLLGRSLTSDDDRTGAAAAVVISYRFWQRQFGLDPKALGQTLVVNNRPCTIVGILPHEYADPLPGNPSEFYVPMAFRASMLGESSYLASPDIWALQVMTRLAPGASDSQALASLNVLFGQALLAAGQKKAASHLRIVLDDGRKGPLSASLTWQQIAKPTLVLMAAVAILLLIACANLASLLLARAAARTRELAVRAAIGAGRWKLLRLFLTEGLLLAICGGALGLLLAVWTCSSVSGNFFSRWMPGNAQLEAALDANVLIFTFGISLLTAVFFSVLPAWRAACMDPLAGLKSDGSRGISRPKLGGILVSVQVGFSVVLLVGMGLLARSFLNLERLHLGFDADHLLIFDLSPSQSGYNGERKLHFFETIRVSLAALPGVGGVTISSEPLLGGRSNYLGIAVPGYDEPNASAGQLPTASLIGIDESYFSTMGIPVLLGRNLNAAEVWTASRVALVNKSFARRYLKNKNPVGAEFMLGGTTFRIVGVGGDARYGELKNDVPPVAYLPLAHNLQSTAAFAIRSRLPVESLAPAVRKAVAAIDPKVPVAEITTQRKLIDRLKFPERMLAAFGGVVSVLAVLLAGIGLFGLLAYTVSRRTGEIGIRMALGAQRSSVIKLIVRQGVALVAAGAVLGCAIAAWAVRLLGGFLFGVQPTDPTSFIVALLVLAVVALLACYLPARRAARIDPLVALRAE